MDTQEKLALTIMRESPDLKKILDELLAALKGIAKPARSWHDFHCGSDCISCDEICAALPQAEAAIKKYEETK